MPLRPPALRRHVTVTDGHADARILAVADRMVIDGGTLAPKKKKKKFLSDPADTHGASPAQVQFGFAGRTKSKLAPSRLQINLMSANSRLI